MPDILTLLLGTFALYILLYGGCWSIDKTDIEKHNRKIKLNKYTFKILFRMYIYIFLIGGFILVIRVLKKRVKDFISGKSR